MRSCLFAMMFVLLTATTAAAQFGKNPQTAPDGPPPEAGQGNIAEEQAAAPAGPSSNAIFAVIDADGDGVITKTELRKAIRALKTLDADKDGNITLAEASTAGAPSALGGNPAIDRMMENDKDGNGLLTADEVPPHMLPMLQGADTNGDTAIDRRELAAAMSQMNNQFHGGPGAAVGPNGRGADPTTGRFMQQYDQDGDGKLSSKELPARLRQSFHAGDDLDGDGSIDPGELQAVIARMGGGARAWAAGKEPGAQRTPFRDPNRRNRPRAGEEKN
jgi:Ca2+-binding EF-hand superfamily protein